MSTAYKVIWSEKAKKGVASIVAYLEQNWTETEVHKFLSELRERVHLISEHPTLFKLVEGTEYTRFSVLTKQTSIYYEFQDERIEILYVFDTRQNPKKLKF